MVQAAGFLCGGLQGRYGISATQALHDFYSLFAINVMRFSLTQITQNHGFGKVEVFGFFLTFFFF